MRRRFINISGDVIYYTSTDKYIVSPSEGSLGTSIVSNTYDGTGGKILCRGKVIIIGENAFKSRITLKTITIPRNVVEISANSFMGCTNLHNITIPDSVTEIGYAAFCNCDSLTSVTIGDSVTTIGYYAFYGCSSLTNVYCKATTPPPLGNTYVFDNNGSGRKIYVPYQSLDAYRTATYWSGYAADIVGYDFEKNLIYNKGVVSGNTVTFDYPVATDIDLQYTTNMGSSFIMFFEGTASKSITLGPGETLVSIDSISPTEDTTYVYGIAK